MKEKKKKAGIIAFAFGAPHNIPSNKALAEIALKKAKELDAIIFTQYDVSLDENFNVVRPNEIMNCPPTTYELSFKAIEWAKKNEIRELWIVAAPYHTFRCLRDLHYVAWEKNFKVEIKTCDEVKNFTDWFSRKSMQWWTQSSLHWWLRELPILFTPMPLYKKMTSD